MKCSPICRHRSDIFRKPKINTATRRSSWPTNSEDWKPMARSQLQEVVPTTSFAISTYKEFKMRRCKSSNMNLTIVETCEIVKVTKETAMNATAENAVAWIERAGNATTSARTRDLLKRCILSRLSSKALSNNRCTISRAWSVNSRRRKDQV